MLASGVVAEKIVAVGWQTMTGRPAPKDDDKLLSYQLGEVAAFAIVSGAVMSLTRQLTLRQAAKWREGRELRLAGRRATAVKTLEA